eukprot:TRINITY_DN57734_c0_g1_i1.p1 TRINITY_DN57734_c0_g1~~TRINITY_DN57734_c0_g1_i1.p1  ORF type:complete len:512 (+),score=72.03 TRINITY_DN57734_c0_g1_i1:91-1626(+)
MTSLNSFRDGISVLECNFFFFFKQKTAYEMQRGLVGSEMCIRDREDSDHELFEDEAEEKAKHLPLLSPSRFSGVRAMQSFFTNYKNLHKNITPLHLKTCSASGDYLMQIDKQKSIPHPMGITKYNGHPGDLNLHSYKMGDKFAKAFGHGLRHMMPEVLNISDNRLSKEGSEYIIKNLKPSIKLLNLSDNIIGSRGAALLGDFIKQKAMHLRVINLENTQLGDLGTIQLCQSLVDHPRISELNLAKNRISDLSCQALADMIDETFNLVNLNLHWNTIGGEGALLFLKASIHHGNLKIVDLSWNSLGSTRKKGFATGLANLLVNQDNFIHLDLSHNNIKAEDCNIIAEGLAENHTLWGLHMIGNEAQVDSKGFLQINQEKVQFDKITAEHLARRINGRSMVIAHQDGERLRTADNCWICEGWNEVSFKLRDNPELLAPSPSGKLPNQIAFFLHLECDNYEPDLMILNPSTMEHYIYRMCPPGHTKFFFSSEGRAFCDSKYPMYSALILSLIHI